MCLLHHGQAYAQSDSLNVPDGKVYFEQNDSLSNSTDTTVQQTHVPPTNILKYKNRREFYYMHYLDSLLRKRKDLRTDTVSFDEKSGRIRRGHQREQQPSSLNKILNSWPLKIFFWALAIIFVVFISYKVFFKSGIFVSRKRPVGETNEEFLQELNEVSAYDNLIAGAENNGEYNLATRYLFLKTLKSLSDKGFIHFASEKTNKEYVREMEQHAYYDEFRELTRDYEYVWYGKFLIDNMKYQKLKEQFDFFNKKI
jgi:hypothetical protein